MTECTTGVGRIVWGNPGKAQIKKDPQTKQPIIRDGQQVQQWAFGVAFPKAEFQQLIWPAMFSEVATVYPNGAAPQKFSWKYKDGDGVDDQGKPYSAREGWAGCYVLTVTTEAFAPPIYRRVNGVFQQMNGAELKTGDYVACGLNFKINIPQDRTHTPGLYVNPQAIEFVGYGPEIHNGADPDALFGQHHYQLPPGASATPIGSGGPAMPGMTPQPQPGQPAMPGGMPGQPPAGYPAPQPAPAPMQPPAPGYGGPAGYPAPQPAPGVPGQMPPPATGFAQAAPAGMPGQPPAGYPAPQPAPGVPGQMPGMPAPR